MAAALMLGAQGVMMGTRFLTSKECNIHDNIKNKLVNSQELDTTLICKSIGLQARALKNKNVLGVLDLEARGASLEEIIPMITGGRISQAWETGDVDLAPMMVGQVGGPGPQDHDLQRTRRGNDERGRGADSPCVRENFKLRKSSKKEPARND